MVTLGAVIALGTVAKLGGLPKGIKWGECTKLGKVTTLEEVADPGGATTLRVAAALRRRVGVLGECLKEHRQKCMEMFLVSEGARGLGVAA